MSNKSAVLVLAALLAACSPSSGGGGSSDCALFCRGLVECSTSTGTTCTWTVSLLEVSSRCNSTCNSIASTMTQQQISEAVTCLHCMDTQLHADGGVCTTAMQNTLQAAQTACGATCQTSGPTTFLNGFGMMFFPQDGGIYRCP
jgi:hypothetical protein